MSFPFNPTIFTLCYIISVLSRKFDVQAFLLPLLNNQLLDQMNIATDLVLRFPNGCIKVVIELGMISDQITLPSVQLPLLTSHLFNGLNTGSMSFTRLAIAFRPCLDVLLTLSLRYPPPPL